MKACVEHQVPLYLQMSALNADAENGSSEYLRSKGRAEACVVELGTELAWTMFRSSIIFGEQDAFFNRLTACCVPCLYFPWQRRMPGWLRSGSATYAES